MIEDFVNDCMDSLDSIDTSEIEYKGMDEETSEFYDSFEHDEDVLFDFDTEDIAEDGSIFEHRDSDLEDDSESNEHHHKSTKGSSISFTGNGRCRVCGCGAWAGFGDTCENCGHFYNKHI